MYQLTTGPIALCTQAGILREELEARALSQRDLASECSGLRRSDQPAMRA